MSAATTDLVALGPGEGDPAWEHAVAIWISNASLLLATAGVLTILTALLLARLDPRQRPHSR